MKRKISVQRQWNKKFSSRPPVLILRKIMGNTSGLGTIMEILFLDTGKALLVVTKYPEKRIISPLKFGLTVDWRYLFHGDNCMHIPRKFSLIDLACHLMLQWYRWYIVNVGINKLKEIKEIISVFVAGLHRWLEFVFFIVRVQVDLARLAPVLGPFAMLGRWLDNTIWYTTYCPSTIRWTSSSNFHPCLAWAS